MILRDPSPILLTQLYNDITPISDGECVPQHLNKIYSKFSKRKLNYSKHQTTLMNIVKNIT